VGLNFWRQFRTRLSSTLSALDAEQAHEQLHLGSGMKLIIQIVLLCVLGSNFGCRNEAASTSSPEDDWGSLGSQLQYLASENKTPDDLLRLLAVPPEVDSRILEDRIWLRRQEFTLDNQRPLLENQLPRAGFNDFDVTLVWLGKNHLSSRYAYAIAWRGDKAAFFSGALCCVN